MPPRLALEHVTHTYSDGTTAVNGVTLQFRSGELTALVGPSGSGKTTLLSIAGLLTRPTTGTVDLNGQRIGTGLLQARRHHDVAWIFQTSNVFGRRTALDNVQTALLAAGVPTRQATERAVAALAAVSLTHKQHTPARLLSGGETQRVGVARAFARRPAFLFADEPTGQLDRASTQLVLDGLRSLARQGGAIVIATHDQFVAESCDRTIRLVDGKAA